jgi:hypothetical protein
MNIFKHQIKLVNRKEAEDDQKERKIKKSFLEMTYQISQTLQFCSLICSLTSRFSK